MPSVADHYNRPNLTTAVLSGLAALGKDPEALKPADLAPIDQFHIGAHGATLALMDLADLQPGMRVLDIGGGLGGAARTLALEAGARVIVLDLTAAYVRLGADLTRRTGLADRIAFHHGDATQLPFRASAFDTVWTQHSTMNVANKDALYRGIWRVLRPGGRLALHEIMAGPQAGAYFPAPWASQPQHSFLGQPADVRAHLQELGFRERVWNDITAEAREWWRARRLAAPLTPSPLGLHLLLGPETPSIVANLMRSLDEDRLTVIQAVFERP